MAGVILVFSAQHIFSDCFFVSVGLFPNSYAHMRAYIDTPTAFDILPALLRPWLHSSRD